MSSFLTPFLRAGGTSAAHDNDPSSTTSPLDVLAATSTHAAAPMRIPSAAAHIRETRIAAAKPRAHHRHVSWGFAPAAAARDTAGAQVAMSPPPSFGSSLGSSFGSGSFSSSLNSPSLASSSHNSSLAATSVLTGWMAASMDSAVARSAPSAVTTPPADLDGARVVQHGFVVPPQQPQPAPAPATVEESATTARRRARTISAPTAGNGSETTQRRARTRTGSSATNGGRAISPMREFMLGYHSVDAL
ncbi:hypothetical protein GGF31_001242 [Allomyces arbusculus]|nr:hypothetical protein GGF31_001242 [Allomyces arbusculus]